MVRNVSIFRSQDRTSHHRRDRRTHVCRTQFSTRIHRALEVRHLQSQRPFEMGARQRDKHRSSRSSEERLTLLHQQLCTQNNLYRKISIVCVSVLCVTLGVTGIVMDLFCLFQQGATGVPEERWPTKTSSGTRVNVPAKLVTCCSRCALLSWWFMYVVLLLTATRVSCFTFHLTSEAFMGVWQVAFRSVRISISVSGFMPLWTR